MEISNQENNPASEKKNGEGFADFVGGIENAVSISPSTIISESDLTSNTKPLNASHWFSLKRLLYVGVGLSIVGMLSYQLWFFAAGFGLLVVLGIFFKGIIEGFSGKSFNLVGYAIASLVLLVLVGFGTCVFNLKLN